MNEQTLGLKAKWIFPVAQEPLSDGVVWIEGDRIASVGQGGRARGARDLGDVAILPGLVNAHTHLELGGFPQPLGRPGIPFVEWIGEVTASRRSAAYNAVEAVSKGLEESAAAGVAALGEIAQPGWPEQLFNQAGDRATRTARIDATVFLELIGPTADRADQAWKLAERHIDQGQRGPWRPGLSPHAPYSVRPELVERACRLSAEKHFPVAMHLAESREELEWLENGGGPLCELLERLGAGDAGVRGGGRRPNEYLEMLAAADRALVVHGNYLDRGEIEFLARQRETMTVVYCPRTHDWFQHAPYPLEAMLDAQVAVALGTDSRASSPDLNLLEEVRSAARRHPGVSKTKILELATLGGAKALGLDAELGTIEPGKRASLAIAALAALGMADW